MSEIKVTNAMQCRHIADLAAAREVDRMYLVCRACYDRFRAKMLITGAVIGALLAVGFYLFFRR